MQKDVLLLKIVKTFCLLSIAFLVYMPAFSQWYCYTTPLSVHGQLSVSGNSIVNEHGRRVSLPGLSLSLSNTGYGQERFYSDNAVEYVSRASGAIVRAPVGVEGPGGYIEDPIGNMQRVLTVIDAAIERDLYVVVDWHSAEAENYQSQAIAFFRFIATRYGQTPNIIYEVYGKPLTSAWSATIYPYAAAVIGAIRAIDPDNLIIVGTPSSNQDVDVVSMNPITSHSNIVYALNFHAAYPNVRLLRKAQTALNNGLPLIVTEWSTVEKDLTGRVDEFSTNVWMGFLMDNSISHINWSLSDEANSAAIFLPGTVLGDDGLPTSPLTDSGVKVRSILGGWNNYCPINYDLYGIRLTYPLHTSIINEGNIVTLEAVALIPDGQAKVEFLVDDMSIGTDSVPPYTATWTAVGNKEHRFTAAIDGFASSSVYARVNTSEGDPFPPLAGIGYPASATSFYEGEIITIEGIAHLVDGHRPENGLVLDFFVDDEYLGTDSIRPFTADWVATGVGDHYFRFNILGGASIGWLVRVVEANTPAYPNGAPHRIPGTINATDFNKGGQGVGYFDRDVGNNGDGPRGNENVDTEYRIPQGNVGWIEGGEWLEFLVRVAKANIYDIEFDVASAEGGGRFHVEFDGVDVTGEIAVPFTGGWGNFITHQLLEIPLNEGVQTMRIVFDEGPFNIGNLTFSLLGSNDNHPVACTFGAPSNNPLPTTGYRSYRNIHVLGSNGPDLTNVTDFVINWDLQNNGLYQLSFTTNNGMPDWWVDFRNNVSHRFNSMQPDITFFNTRIPRMDGDYWAVFDGDNFALVSKDRGFTLYFSNSPLPPGCLANRAMSQARSSQNEPSVVQTGMENKNNGIGMYPNPAYKAVTFTFDDTQSYDQLTITDMSGKAVYQERIESDRVTVPVDELNNGTYIVKIKGRSKLDIRKLIVLAH